MYVESMSMVRVGIGDGVDIVVVKMGEFWKGNSIEWGLPDQIFSGCKRRMAAYDWHVSHAHIQYQRRPLQYNYTNMLPNATLIANCLRRRK